MGRASGLWKAFSAQFQSECCSFFVVTTTKLGLTMDNLSEASETGQNSLLNVLLQKILDIARIYHIKV
jgi:hypothetical protein